MRRGVCALALGAAASSCMATGGGEWVRELPEQPSGSEPDGWSQTTSPSAASSAVSGEAAPGSPASVAATPEQIEPPLVIRDHGGKSAKRRGLPAVEASWNAATDVFRNTYYDFPREGPGDKDAVLYDAKCEPIARVTREFHDRVCVQGSGKLSSGSTVSFAKRGCSCAAKCPRTDQKVCFERLDPALFPSGRGATGRAITPLRTVAVDSSVIPLGATLYIPEFVGLSRPDGSLHDGCFVAEDRGLKIVGRQIDVFTGDPDLTELYNRLIPSNRGVHVVPNDPRCGTGP